MAVSKSEIDKYVNKIEGRLNSAHERNLKGLAFAELYRKVDEFELAKTYTLAYISTNNNDYRGHKFLGKLLEDCQDYHEALESYKRSFDIYSDQNDVLLKIVKLYTELKIDPEIAKVWADRANKCLPGEPAVFDLQVHLIELKKPVDYDELIDVIAKELIQRPRDSSLHTKLVKTYIQLERLEDAYDHCVSVNKTKAFHKDLAWFLLTVEILERYLELKESQVKQYSRVSRQGILQEIYIALLTAYCNLVELNLSHSSLRKSSTSLLRLDQLLYQAINLDNGFSSSTDLSEANEWDVAITEIRAQLYMLSGHLLLRLAKENYSTWSQSLEMATVCYITSYRVSEPEMTSPWVAKASNERNPFSWLVMAASRLSQTGHLILSTLDRYGEEKINNMLLNLCSPQGQEDILTTLYGHYNDFSKLFLSEDESFLTPEFTMPDQLMKYDEMFIAKNPLNLELIAWIGLQWYQHGQETEPGIEIVVSQMFHGLRMDVHDVTQCSAEFVSLRDIEAFIYAVIKCSAYGRFENLDVSYEYYEPKLLPLCLGEPLCIPTQVDWWNCMYTFVTGAVSVQDSGKVKMKVQRGLEQIRTLKKQGMHPKLVIYLAINFGQKSSLIKDTAGYTQWYYSTHWKSFQLRSLHYWNVALSLFEDMKRNRNPGCPKEPLFPHNLSQLEEHDIHRYFREACMILGEAAVEKGDFEHALNLFNRVESSHAAWNEAQIFKHLAGLESNNADVDDRAYDSYTQYLNEAKDRLMLCLERLEYDKIVRDAVEEELAAIESLLNERKSFYHVDPRKSIDFHQLDFDALKSPVCSDITESGETMPLKENDTRELLATVSEVTLDNGFLREQVSIRDEQVLRLSKQVQDLQSKLARFKQNGDISPASFSFPSERTPSPLEDYESPKVHLETGEKFTRQGTFVNNIVVPTDRCDDPSFFSGLSKSNTPDRIQTVLDEEQEDEGESEQETDEEGGDVYFEPVVQLSSQVEFRSGEEDETVVFEERTKLFRFQDGEWKERGLGNLKLLWNSSTGQARVLMRREKVLKICANHFITIDITLKHGKGSDRSWLWSTMADISEDETKPERFAAKFQSKEIADKFKAKFEELQEKKSSFIPESPAVSPFAANPLATKPTPDHMKIPVLSSNLPYFSSTPNKPVETTAKVETFPKASQISSGVADAANFWNQPHLFPGIANMPYFQSSKTPDNTKEQQIPQKPQVGSEHPLASGATTSNSLTSHGQNTFSFSFSNTPKDSTSYGNEKITIPNEGPQNGNNGSTKNDGIFGDTIKGSSLSFKDLASNKTGNAFTTPVTSGSSFTGFGKPIFAVPDNEREEPNMEEETDIDFKPIVSLPLVKNQATGEEGELVKFSSRAKLFRFDPASKEWKERGLGEIKLLYNPSSCKSRVVMRREQVHKLCANHFILPNMKLKANTTSNRSLLWYTHADVSDGEAKAVQLAVRFKQEETASEFKKIFEELQSISPACKATDPDADQDTSNDNVTTSPSTVQPSQSNSDLKIRFQPPVGSWSCDTCLIQNSAEATSCIACQASKPGLSKQAQPALAPTFSFGSVAVGEKPANNSAISGFNSGFMFTSPSFPLESQAINDKAPGNNVVELPLNFSFPKTNDGKDPKTGNVFSFGSTGSNKDSTPGPEFTFGVADSGKDITNKSGFRFGQSNDDDNKAPAASFSFGTRNEDKDEQSNDINKDSDVSTTDFRFGHSNNGDKAPTTVPSEEDMNNDSAADSTTSDVTTPSAVTKGLKLLFKPPEGSWECNTCLIRNTRDSNVCIACQSCKPGTQETVTNPGFTFNTGMSHDFSAASKGPDRGNVFSFGSTNTNNKDLIPGTGFTFGAAGSKNDETKESSFRFGQTHDDKVPNTGFSFDSQGGNENEQNKNINKDSDVSTAGFRFGHSNDGDKAPTTAFNFGSQDGNKDNTKAHDLRFVPSDERDGMNSGSAVGSTTSDVTTSSAVTKDLKLLFKPPEGSWECDTCLVRNTRDSNVCIACQSYKPGTESTFTNPGLSFDSGKPSGFSFGSQDSTTGSGFNFVPPNESGFTFGPNDKNKGAAFSFGHEDQSRNETKGPSFSFAPDDPKKNQTEKTGFSFGEASQNNQNKDSTNATDFNFGRRGTTEDEIGVSGFNFGKKDSNKEIGFTFGPTNVTKGSGFTADSSTSNSNLEKQTNISTELANDERGGDDEDTESEETTESDYDSEASEEYSIKCREESSEDSFLKLPTPGSTDLSEKDLRLIFKPPAGSWECEMCMIRNNADVMTCLACQTPKPGSHSSPKSLSDASNASFSFGKTFSGGFTFAKDPKDNPQSGFNFNLPTNEKSKDSEESGPTFSDLMKENDKPGFSFNGSGDDSKGFNFVSTENTQSGLGFNFGDNQKNPPLFNFGNSGDGTGKDYLQLENKKNVESKEIPKLFQGVFTFRMDIPKDGAVTSPSNKGLNVSENNPEEEDEGVVFKPIVSLPKQVEVKSGEEDEITLFNAHAKLYRFTQNTWKERGVGEIKVLYDPSRERGRIIMRRDQVHIVCANHFISKGMQLKPQGSSGKSWMWHTQGDFADNEVKKELFAVKFKDTDTALAFKRAFEECVQSMLEDGVVEDEVIIVYEVSVSDEQRAKADKFLLPPHFYVYENQTEINTEAKQHVHKTSSSMPGASDAVTHSFVFGSSDITSLSFGALAGKTSGFKSSPNKAFTGAGSQLFVQDINQDVDDPEREVSGIDFKPVVQLDEIHQSSSEENEDVIYSQRAKLYRFDKNTSQWKERGVGNLKLLKHKITGHFRVLMRRDQILKVCANHFLTTDMELKRNANSDRSWMWHTIADVSDGEPKAEQLAIKFKNAEIAQEFKENFDMCKEELVNVTVNNGKNEKIDEDKEVFGVEKKETVSNAGEHHDLDHVSPHITPRDTSRTDSTKESDTPLQEEKIPLSSSSTTPSRHTPREQTKGSSDSRRKARTSSSSTKSPPREILSSIDEPSPSSEPFTRVNFNFHSIVAGKAIYTGLDEETVTLTQTDGLPNKSEIVKELFPDTQDSKSESKLTVGKENKEAEDDGPVFKFGSNNITSLSFASLANQSTSFPTKAGEHKGFVGSGEQLFSSNVENDPKKEVEGTDFKPIVSLPDIIERKTGEEEETLMYSHRAKLFRYDTDAKQWKERGVGDIKILHHNETKKYRVVMRREQIHKLCANHYITADMELKENAGSDRSWVWSVNADFADGVAKSELFAVRFKNREDAAKFREMFIECQQNNEMKVSEVSPVEENPSDDQDDEVVVVFEKVPSPEQKERAKLYNLPETYYCFEEESPEEIAAMSEKYDKASRTSEQVQKSVSKHDQNVQDKKSDEKYDSGSEKKDVNAESEENTPVFQFGPKETSILSFAQLAEQTSGFSKSTEGTWKGFLGSGEQLFCSNVENDPEKEVEGTDFKPIVSLPDIIERKTGEEEEIVMYSHRAKLFRYDTDAKQWKERGVGDIKILLHNETKKYRVVMRREQIHKLCANHYITADMELKENAGSDRSWVWSVNADFADGVAKSELFAVRFKNSEDAAKFREMFIECQQNNKMKISEVSPVEEKPSDDQDDEVVVVFEKVPSPEQKERAKLYNLPETYYCFEEESPEKIATMSEKYDKASRTSEQVQKSVPKHVENFHEKNISFEKDKKSDEKYDSGSEKRDVNAESEENTPVFQFGPKETSILSFAQLAEQTSGFPRSPEGTWKGFLGSGEQLFCSKVENDPEKEVEGTDFKPIVSLPDIIERKTGEEEETVIYSHRAKLFRYDTDAKQWKERGVGDIKILLHNETKKYRVVMRREQIHKLCANHYITADMELKENTGSDRSWVWSVNADFADGVAKSELFAVRFKNREDAAKFREMFIECQQNNEMKVSEVSIAEEKPSDDQDDEVVVVFEKFPSPEQKERAKLYKLPETYYCFDEESPEEIATMSEKCDKASRTPEQVQKSVSKHDQNVQDEKSDEKYDSGSEKRDVNAESEENTPVFQFGPKETSILSFAQLAEQTSGFPRSTEGTWKGFLGSGEQLFCSNVENDPEKEVEGTDFKPIVSLPDIIERKTGEEEETVIYSHRAKLFRYDTDAKQWKERGVGDIKILLHNETKKYRVVMRREQIHKLCANHYITADMELKENAGSDRSWVWSVNADFADGVAKSELFAVRFKNREDAAKFREMFIECQQSNEMKADVSSVEEEQSDDQDDEVVVVFEKVPSAEQKERAKLYELPKTFYCFEEVTVDNLALSNLHTTQGILQTVVNEVNPVEKPRYKLNVVDESSTNVPEDNNTTAIVDHSSTTTYAHSFVFGSSDITSLSFGALAGKTSEFKSSPNKAFTGAGSQLFVQETNQDVDDPEREVSGIDFKPVVQLDEVHQSSGEENEDVIYSQRAKLYRYDKNTSQWKERGVGNLKLLKHKITGHFRVLMRRDQILKVCANHFLTTDMELKRNANSDRSWMWHTIADVSDGEPKAEQLAIKFKNAEIAQEFKEKFDMCNDELKLSLLEDNIRGDDNKMEEKQSEYEIKVGNVLAENDDNNDIGRSTQNVALNFGLPATAKPFSCDDIVGKPENKFPQMSYISSHISHAFYSDYLLRWEKEDIKDRSHDVQVLFSRDAEVYFFDEEQEAWRERGYGTLQILCYDDRYHIFMSNQAKICVAHLITSSMDLKPNAGSDRSWVWFTLEDYSDIEILERELAAEFQSVEHSFEFKKVFDECRDSCGVPHEGHVHAMAASFDSNTHKLPSHCVTPLMTSFVSATHKLPSHGMTPLKAIWRICCSCKVENSAENTSCLVCGKSFTEEDPPVVEPTRKPKRKTKPFSPRKLKKRVPSRKHVVAKESSESMYKPVTKWWKCYVCGVENNLENSHCFVCTAKLSCSPEISVMLEEISKT